MLFSKHLNSIAFKAINTNIRDYDFLTRHRKIKNKKHRDAFRE